MCYNCFSNHKLEECTHTDEERAFMHTYFSPEIELALNSRYDKVQVFDVLHWSETEIYDPDVKLDGLFSGYTFLKHMQQVSGFLKMSALMKKK